MECLYSPDLKQSDSSVILSKDEEKHLRVLRLKDNEEIHLSNGKGLLALAKVNFRNNAPIITPIEFYKNYGELKNKITVAICQIQSRERLEFLVEKAVELGVVEIIIVHCDYSQKINISEERLKNKAIAALKQSHRSVLPQIKFEKSIQSLISNIDKNIIPILLDENVDSPIKENITKDAIIFVGCEGGFSKSEIDAFNQIENLRRWNLGNRRLRAETAAIKAISILSAMLEVRNFEF